MAAISTAQAGNWSDPDTWGGSVPGDGDTATINHAVTVDVDTTVGTAPNPRATVLAVNARLTLAQDVKLSVKGEIVIANTDIRCSGGGHLQIVVASGLQYRIQISTANNQNGSRLQWNATSDNRGTIDYTGGGTAIISTGGFTGGGRGIYQYTDITLDAMPYRPYNGATGTFAYELTGCVVHLATGGIDRETTGGSPRGFSITDSTIYFSGSGDALDLDFGLASSGQARSITGTVVVGGMTRVYAGGVTLEDNLFLGGLAFSDGGTPTSYERNFIARDADNLALADRSNTDNIYLYNDTDNNPHFTQPTANASVTFDGAIFQYDGTVLNGDGVLGTTPGSARTYRLVNCIVLGNANESGPSCSLLTTLGNSNCTFQVEHCTFATGTGLHGVGIETYAGHVGMVEYVRSCLGFGRAVGSWIVSAVTTPVDDCITEADYNCGWDTVGGQAFTDNYEPTDAKFGTAPGANDVNVDPQFVAADPWQVRLKDWDSTLGGAGTTANALAEMALKNEPTFNSNYTVSAFRTWVRSQLAPTNSALATAAHDGTHIGAIPVTAADVELDAELAAVAAVDAALHIGRNPAADLAAVAELDGSLTVGRSPAAELDATAVVDAALTVARTLDADLAAVAVVDAEVTEGENLATDLAGVAATDAALTVGRFLSADVAGVAVVDGAVAVKQRLDADLAGVAATDAALTVERQLAADAAGIAVVDGVLAQGVTLDADLVSVADVDGALTAQRNLVAELAAVAVVDADVTEGENLAADLAAVASVDGALTVSRPLVADLAGVAVVDADVTEGERLAADLAGVAAVDGELTIAGRIEAELAGAAVADAALHVGRNPAAEIEAAAVTDATLTVERNPSADLEAAATLDGAATVRRTPASEVEGVAVTDAALTVERNPSAELEAAASIDATLTAARNPAAELDAAATVDAALTVEAEASAELDAGAHVDATLTITRTTVAELVALAELDARLVLGGTERLLDAEVAGTAALDGALSAEAHPTIFVDEVARWLIDGNLASGNFRLFRGSMPSVPHRAVALIERGGPSKLPNVNVERRRFQVVVRGAPITQVSSGYEEARAHAQAIRDRLHFTVGQDIEGVHYAGIQADQEPAFHGPDMEDRPVFSCTYLAMPVRD